MSQDASLERNSMAWLSERTALGSKGVYGGIFVVGTRALSGSRVTKSQESYGVPVRGVAQNSRPSNKGLEQTGRVGVPASRAVVRGAPCSSTQCCTGTTSSRV